MMKALICLLLLPLLMMGNAQDDSCLEVWFVWSDDVRHAVNLDTGEVMSYPPRPYEPPESINPTSFDGRYAVNLEQNSRPWIYNLTLIDNKVGVSFLLEEKIFSSSWSPNSAQLAYIRDDGDDNSSLILRNIENGEAATAVLPKNLVLYLAKIMWSPDGRFIAVPMNVGFEPETWEIRLYSVPDLTLLDTYPLETFSPVFTWSPSGRYFLGHAEMGILIDTESGQSYKLDMTGGPYYNRFYWSFDESYLITTYSVSDRLDEFDVLTPQGEIVMENIIVDTNYDNSRSQLDWVGDTRMIVITVIVETAVHNLTLFDLQTGEEKILVPHLRFYRLSPDNRHVAALGEDNLIQVYDFSTDAIGIETITVDDQISNFIWHENGLELMVLFEDRSLRRYDLETGIWHDIAIIPGEDTMMQFVPCTP